MSTDRPLQAIVPTTPPSYEEWLAIRAYNRIACGSDEGPLMDFLEGLSEEQKQGHYRFYLTIAHPEACTL